MTRPLDPCPLHELDRQDAAEALRWIVQQQATHAPLRGFPVLRALAPEVAYALGHLALARGFDEPPSLEGLDPAVAASWHRALLARDARTELDDDALERAIAAWPHHVRSMPAALLRRCAAHPRPEVAIAAIEAARNAVRACELRPREAASALEPLARHANERCRRALARALQAWASPVRAPLVALLSSDPDDDVVLAACPMERDVDVLLDLVSSSERRSDVRVAASIRLGEVGDHEVLASMLALRPDDPCVTWGGVRGALVELHRRGVFVREDQLEELLAVFEADVRFDAATLVRLTFTCRHALVRTLESIEAGDPRWVRLALVLATCEGDGASALFEVRLREAYERVGERTALEAVIASTRLEPRVWPEPPVAEPAVTPAPTDWEVAHVMLLASARCSSVSEPLLRAFLGVLPESAAEALSIHGTDDTARAIASVLRDPLAFGGARAQVVELAWRLAESRAGLAGTLDPLDLRPEWLRDVVDQRLPIVVMVRLGPDAPAATQLEAIVDGADVGYLSTIESLFRATLLEELVFDPHVRPRDPSESLRCERAVLRYGARLVALGRRFSRWGAEIDRELVRVFALRWLVGTPLEDIPPEPPRDAVQVALLGMLRRVGVETAHLPMLHRLWRHRSPDVRRAAMELLLESAGTEGLELSLCQLAETAEDEPTLRQALRAIAHFEAHWAERFAAAALAHPNMNVKRTAAATLAVVGTADSVDVLTAWLLRHDNAGFRNELLLALDRAAGGAATATLLEAFESAEGRARELACTALERRLTLADVLRLVRAERAGDVVSAALDGRIALMDASREELRVALGDRSRDAPASRMLVFSEDGARAAVADATARNRFDRLDAAIRAREPEWLAAALDDASLAPHVLRAITVPSIHAPEVVALIARHGASAPRESFRLARGLSATPHASNALAAIRAIPPTHEGGLARWETLTVLHAVTTRDDVHRSLADARLAGREAVQTFLRTALGLDEHELDKAERDVTPLLDRRPRARTLPTTSSHASSKSTSASMASTTSTSLASGFSSPDEVARRLRDAASAPRAAAEVLVRAELDALLPQVLELYLDGAVDTHLLKPLARVLMRWPTDTRHAERAVPLIAHLPSHRRRVFAPRWLAGWERGEPWAARALATLPTVERVALVESRLLREPALAAVLELGGVSDHDRRRLPAFFAPPEPSPAPPPEPANLEEWIVEARTSRGRRAARALRVIAKQGAAAALQGLTTHSDSHVRLAALRHLRRLVPHTEYLEQAYQLLELGGHPQHRRMLVRVLGHAAYPPAIPRIAELVLDPDVLVARAARDALLALGDAARPALVHMRAHARPDRRAVYEELLSKLP